MAKLAYCKRCKATYPLNIVVSDGGRSGKTQGARRAPWATSRCKELTPCPSRVQEVAAGRPRAAWRPPSWSADQVTQVARAVARCERLPVAAVRRACASTLSYNYGISFSRFAGGGRASWSSLVVAVAVGVAVALVLVPPRYRLAARRRRRRRRRQPHRPPPLRGDVVDFVSVLRLAVVQRGRRGDRRRDRLLGRRWSSARASDAHAVPSSPERRRRRAPRRRARRARRPLAAPPPSD